MSRIITSKHLSWLGLNSNWLGMNSIKLVDLGANSIIRGKTGSYFWNHGLPDYVIYERKEKMSPACLVTIIVSYHEVLALKYSALVKTFPLYHFVRLLSEHFVSNLLDKCLGV